MGEDYRKQLRRVDWALDKEAKKRNFYTKVQENFARVKRFVDKEIEGNNNFFLAIDKVLNNKSITKFCPDLKDESLKRSVRRTLMSYYIASQKNKTSEENQISEGEER